jgi:isopropylmalate/homocitrate/citramalate synthase
MVTNRFSSTRYTYEEIIADKLNNMNLKEIEVGHFGTSFG